MKKLFFAIYTISLVVLAPAVFAGYLYSSNNTAIAQKKEKTEKQVITAQEPETGCSVTMLIAAR
jgi:hypothetical protein